MTDRRRVADLVVLGRIATLAGATGYGWVEAMAVASGRVVAVGRPADVEPVCGPSTRTLALDPRMVVVPGLIDAHLHLSDSALAAQRVDLESAGTLAEGLDRIAAMGAVTADRDGWLLGGGWDPGRWGRWPTAWDLGAMAHQRIALWSHDHHSLWVSARVLTELGVDAATADPPGGSFQRSPDGSPDGVLQENAVQAVVARLPRMTGPALEALISSYARRLVGLGVVGVHEPGDLLADATLEGGFAAIAALADRADLPIRVHASIRAPALAMAIERGLRTGASLGGEPDGRARMGWIKLFADGALGSRTALVLEPYAGSEDDYGVAVTPPQELTTLARRAAAAGIVPQVHAIGDAALRGALDALEPVAPPAGPMARVEHVQLAHPTDVPRLARGRVAASIQPIHLRSDIERARAAWGPRADRQAFLLRSLLTAGVTVGFGTDAPVEPPDPWPGLALAVTRIAPEWPSGEQFGQDEAINLPEALRASTVGPASIAGEFRGRLTPGSPADFLAIPAAALREPVEVGGALWSTRPNLVAIDGRIVHEA